MLWSLLLCVAAVILAFVASHTMRDVNDLMHKISDKLQSTDQYVDSLVLPYAMFASWALSSFVYREEHWQYSIFCYFLLFITPFYYIMASKRFKILTFVCEFGAIFFTIRSILTDWEPIIVAALSISMVVLSKFCLSTDCLNTSEHHFSSIEKNTHSLSSFFPSFFRTCLSGLTIGGDMKKINILASLTALVPLLIFSLQHSTVNLNNALIMTTFGALSSYFMVRQTKDIGGLFLFYGVAVISARLYRDTHNVYVALPILVMVAIYAAFTRFMKIAVVQVMS